MPQGFSTEHVVATALFCIAILHTFSASFFKRVANRYQEGSVGENFFHLIGEVEVVFGLWAAVFFGYLTLSQGERGAVDFLESQNFREPVFVFVIMTLSATRPILVLAGRMIMGVSRLLPIHPNVSFLLSSLILGPLMGSLITEPAAMTVTALILKKHFFDRKASNRLKYLVLGTLFVSVSVGGTLTHFAAPPVLMVAGKWGWHTPFMLAHFGYRAFIIVAVSALFTCLVGMKELPKIDMGLKVAKSKIPSWLSVSHLLFLYLAVLFSHHIVVFVGVFLFFLGLVAVTREYQEDLKLREALLVGFFLGGLVVLGAPQRWWLEPLLGSLSDYALYFGATALTAVTDNAALTYLGSQVPGLSEATKYYLVAGAVTGGGLTVIANAPNPAGYGILQDSFGDGGISAAKLFVAALIPTLIAIVGFLI